MERRERRLSDRRSSGSLYPASTSLLLKVEVPASGFDCLLNFAVKVAKLDCEQQLQDWQSRLSEATLAVLRADRSRSELSKLRESYWREVQNLRQQLYQKQQAKEHGKEFVPDSVDLFSSKEAGNEFNDVLLQQMNRMEDEHQAEIASWKQKNSELLKKMKAKVRGVEMETYDADVQTDDREVKEASCQVCDSEWRSEEAPAVTVSTSCQTFDLEGISINNFVHPDVKDLGAVHLVDCAMQTESGWWQVEMKQDVPKNPGQKARTKSTEMTDHSYQDLDSENDSDESMDESDESDEGDLEDLQPMSPLSPVFRDPVCTQSETQTDVDATVDAVCKPMPNLESSDAEEIPMAKNPTLLGVTRTPTSATSPSPQHHRFHRPQLQVTTCESLEHSDVERVKTFPTQIGKERKHEKNHINSAELEHEKTHLSTPREAQRSSSHPKKTKLPGLKTFESEIKSRPVRRSSLTFPEDGKDGKDGKDGTPSLTFPTFPLCPSPSSARSDSSRPAQRTIRRPRLSSRRLSTSSRD